MASEWRYRGRVVTADELTFIRKLIAENQSARRRAPGRQPAQTLREALRGMAVETGQRRFARYGVPRLVAHAASGRRDRITAHRVPGVEFGAAPPRQPGPS